MSQRNQSAREANIKAIISYFENGIKSNPSLFGIELEHILVHENGDPVPYEGPQGVARLLECLQKDYSHADHSKSGTILGLFRETEAITLEPAAQVELSAGPFKRIQEAEKIFKDFELNLERYLKPAGIEVRPLGYHPTRRAVDLQLIPKQRYEFMNAYLGSISSYGICMMRGSASTQISIDYSSVEDCLLKLRLAFALGPIFSLITDNSPVFEAEPRTHQLVRTQIWRYCDPDRCGLIPGVMDESFTLRDYAEYILDTPAILVPDKKGGFHFTEEPFGEIYASNPMSKADVEHALSMFFTDARLKSYLEIRPADAMPLPQALAYAALIKGLFYSPENLQNLHGIFKDVSAEDVEAAKTALMASGYRAQVYGHDVAELADELMSLAALGLDEQERAYLVPLASLVASRVTLADLS